MIEEALRLENISKVFGSRVKGQSGFLAVDNVSLSLKRNEILGLVGESGSGKSTTGLMALRLLEPTSGRIWLEGQDITDLSMEELKPLRKRFQVVFQDSYSALDPMYTVERLIAEPLVVHGMRNKYAMRDKTYEMMKKVGLRPDFGPRYAHELSGGQRQRVAIARALILNPQVLVADEPTSALDVSVKAQIINLLLDLQEDMGLSILFVSHDLGVIHSLTDRAMVMFRGRVVETGNTKSIFENPRHPYTRNLLDAIPNPDPRQRSERSFMTRDQIEASIQRVDGLTGEGQRQLVSVGDDHQVEMLTNGEDL